jgi:hypothetical protein
MMNAHRTIPARPVQSGTAVGQKIVRVVSLSLDASPNFPPNVTEAELARAVPFLALLANAGHLVRGDLVLAAGTLRLTFFCPTGPRAVAATEDMTPGRGAATATTWRLHLPSPEGYDGLLADLLDHSDHFTADCPPAVESSRRTAALIDLMALAEAAEGRR